MPHSQFYFARVKPSLYVVPKLGENLTPEQKYQQVTKPWLSLKVFNDENEKIKSRLPEHYKKFYWEWQHAEKAPVHYIKNKGAFRLSHNRKQVEEVKSANVFVLYPNEVNQGLWGGEGVVKGYLHTGRYKGETARYWFPKLNKKVIYSEVLDKHMEVVCTERFLSLVDDHFGFDGYILTTPHADINSTLGFKLKREILWALSKQTIYPNDPAKKQEMLEKYSKYILPDEELEWLGLTLDEAVEKQRELELQNNAPVPFKIAFRQQILDYLREKAEEESPGKIEG